MIKWSEPKTWTHLVLHPGMMHTLMSFIGAKRTLMKSSGLEEIINAAFGSGESISNGKAYRNAMQAYRLTLSVMLKNVIGNAPNFLFKRPQPADF